MASLYESVIEDIWTKIMLEGSKRRPTTSRSTFDNVCDTFYQAEHCPESELCSSNIKLYRAEWNVHAYYFGEGSKFPGIDPASSGIPASTLRPRINSNSPYQHVALTAPSDNSEAAAIQTRPNHSATQHQAPRQDKAAANRQMLEAALHARNPTYQVQFGWNPTTGEPWFAVRSYADNSFPAMYGPRRKVLHAVAALAPDFVLQFERFPALKYTLMWPEFAIPKDIDDDAVWQRFSLFRAFLQEWAWKMGRVEMMNGCLKVFLNRPEEEKKGLGLPEGFVLDEGVRRRVLGIRAPVRHTGPVRRFRGEETRRGGGTRTSGWDSNQPGGN